MPVNQEFRLRVCAQIAQLVAVTDRAMFGGVGLYADGRMFGILYNDTLYLKADGQSRERFLAAGSFPFSPYGARGSSMGYYAIPEAVYDDTLALRPWIELALGAAQRATDKKPRR